jgi:hypothetical protein
MIYCRPNIHPAHYVKNGKFHRNGMNLGRKSDKGSLLGEQAPVDSLEEQP